MLEACFPRHAALCCTLAELKRRRVISLPAWSSDFSVNAACLKVTWRERRRAESLASNAIEEPAASVRPSAQRDLAQVPPRLRLSIHVQQWRGTSPLQAKTSSLGLC